MSLFKRITTWERDLRKSFNTDLSTPENRRRAHIYNLWFDHAVLRGIWTNQFEIAPGVWRSNHPTHKRFAKLKAQGFKSILNLRGAGGAAHYLTEQESCAKLGLTLVDVRLNARNAAPRKDIQAVIDAFRSIERPFMMHCKSGADRAGFAAAIYLMVIEGRPVSEARGMLSLRFWHVKQSRTGVLGYILDLFEARHAETGIGFEEWIQTEYDNKAVQRDFEAKFKPWF